MDDLLAARVAAQLGAFSHVDAYDCGYTTKTLHRLVASGRARRVGPRAYVDGAAFDAGTPEQRHAMTTRAMVRSSAGRLAASHHSSLSLLALPLFGVPMDVVHLVGTRSPRCRRSPVWQIHRGFGEGSLCRVDGVLSVAPALAVIGAASLGGVEAGVVAADAALAAGRTTDAELRRWLERLIGVPNTVAARRAVDLADARSESVGESRTRLVLHSLGWADAEPQVVIRDDRGDFVARVDFLLRRARVVVEFDGAVKYAGADGRAALVAEKLREDRLRALGYEVVRIVWSDLARPDIIARAVRAAVARAGLRATAAR